MPVITLPDHSQRHYDAPITVHDVAADIGAGLARAALAGVVDGVAVDTSHLIESDATLAIITDRDEAGLEIIRHSTAHLMAMATQQLFPGVQVTIGPVIEDGFYYDFASGNHFSPEDLEKIEQRMAEIVAEDLPVERMVCSREKAVELFRNMGEDYKVQIIQDLPEGEEISIYRQGAWMDLCRGPHVPSTGKLKAFKLTKVAGAYWRGDSNGMKCCSAFTAPPGPIQKAAQAVPATVSRRRKSATIARLPRSSACSTPRKKRRAWCSGTLRWLEHFPDHRAVHACQAQVRYTATRRSGRRSWWTCPCGRKSGHADKFGDDMFMLQAEERDFAVKPMNCPCHVQVFNQGLKSYRDLPLRLAEFGSCHRNEPSGSLHGIMRVRGFVQDDAHIFCTEEQIQPEVSVPSSTSCTPCTGISGSTR